MAASLIAYPFRLSVAGGVVVAPQGSDDYLESQIAVAAATKIGERDMVPSFGVPDPTFSVLHAADLQTCIDRYGPDDVIISSVVNTPVDEMTVNCRITWTRRSLT